MEDIRITLETLYDILRNEKKKEDLQKLEHSFFIDVVSYLKEKKSLLDSKENKEDIFASGEKEKLEYELRSIKRILKEIYEKREKKIIDIALNKSRTGSDIIDTSSMLKEEKAFYQQVLSVLDVYRRGVVLNLFKGELPIIEEEKEQEESTTLRKKVEKKPDIEERPKVQEKEKEPADKEVSMTKVKFIHPTPSFIWKDMKVYGPFDPGEEIEIYPEVADLLVRKGRAEKV